MFWTVGEASSDRNSSTLSTNQIFFFEVLVIILRRLTVFHTSEVGIRAFETHIIRKSLERIPLQIVEEGIAWFFQSRRLVQIFELSPFHRHFNDSSLECHLLIDNLLELRAGLAANFFFASRAL